MRVGLWIVLLFYAVTLVKCRPEDLTDAQHPPTVDEGNHDHEHHDAGEHEPDAEAEAEDDSEHHHAEGSHGGHGGHDDDKCKRKGRCLDGLISMDLSSNNLNDSTQKFKKENPITQSDECTKICYFLNGCTWSSFSKIHRICTLHSTCTEFNKSEIYYVSAPQECAKGHGHHDIRLASWRWKEYNDYFVICVMVAFAAMAKLVFHETHWLSSRFPESCVLIIVGVIFGHIIHYGLESHAHHFPKFTSTLFFNILLPPIILDSAYSLYDRDFLGNLGAVVVFAVIGTLLNVFVIGFGMFGLYRAGAMGEFEAELGDLTAFQLLVFSSLISAVDPVAVLAIFDEIGVNKSLYFLVFGESLFNDGVSVVLYNAFVGLAGNPNAGADQYGLAVLSFFFVAGGGLLIGFFVGCFSAFFCRFTGHTRVVEPLVIFISAYFSFVLSECIHWSGILALIGVGIAQKRYTFQNISKKSLITVKYGIKTFAALSDVIIFIFLGVVTAAEGFTHHFEFIFWAVVLCFVARFIITYGLSAILNRVRIKKITQREQFIMAYGGLRGAVGFSLVKILDDKFQKIFQTATLWMIFITTFVCGGTIKLAVNILGIEKQDSGGGEKKICENVNEKCIDHLMAGVETIVGRKVSNYRILNWIILFEDKYIKKFLVNKNAEHSLMTHLQKLSLDEHYARLYGPTMMVTQDKVQDLLGNNANGTFKSENKGLSRTQTIANPERRRWSGGGRLSKYIKRRHEPTTEYEKEQEALTAAFAGNTFDKMHSKKFGSHYNQDDQDEQVELEMGKMVEKRTKMLWDVSLQATQSGQTPDNDAIQPASESVHDKIKAAYDRSKNSFKKD